MKPSINILLFPLLFFVLTHFSSICRSEDSIRVRLEKDLDFIKITGQNIKVQGASQVVKIAIPSATSIEVKRVLIQAKYFWQVQKGKSIEVLGDKYLVIEGQNLYSKTKSLPSTVILSADQKIDVVGVLPLENYLVGVLASEMPLSWPIESLKAQAVAARSYALAVRNERRNKVFHLESSIMDQVFRHVSQGVDQDPLIEKAFTAVKETESYILTNADKKVLKAYYHADCGGQTSPARSVWGHGDSKTRVTDVSCPGQSKSNWKFEISKQQLAQKLSFLNPLPLLDLQPVRSNQGSRASKIRLKWVDGEVKEILADTFRSKLGYQDFKSADFEVSQNETSYLFRGKGYGHGVGLCQSGSKVLAQKKRSYKEILKHYFPFAELDSHTLSNKNANSKKNNSEQSNHIKQMDFHTL